MSEEFTHTIVAHQYRDGMHEYEERFVKYGVLEAISGSDEYDGEWREEYGGRFMRSFIVGYLTEEQADLVREWKVIY